MSYNKWPKRSAEKNYFMVPNEIFSIGLDYREISLYTYLLRCENRKTYQCYPSYKTIGKAIGMSENTVAKYVRQLEEKGLIYTEPTIMQSKDGKPLNGNLLYTIRPIPGVEWFTRSAERGNPYAQYMLGKLYLTGREVLHDEDRGVHWLTKSAEQDNQYAQYLLAHLEENRPPSAMLAVTRLLHHMSRVFRDNSVPKSRPGGIQVDRKRLKKLQEKRIALGHKPDDHEEQWPDMTM